jgi:hypothetical protein
MSNFSLVKSLTPADGAPIPTIQLIPYTNVFSKERTCGSPAGAIASARRLAKQALIARFPTGFCAPDITPPERGRFTHEVQ